MKVAVAGHVEWIEFARVEHVPVPGEILQAEETWEEAVKTGKIRTSWKYEVMVMTRYSVLPNLLPLFN